MLLSEHKMPTGFVTPSPSAHEENLSALKFLKAENSRGHKTSSASEGDGGATK